MIEIKNGIVKIEGPNKAVMYEFVELYDMMVRIHPEMVNGAVLAWGNDLLKQLDRVDPIIIDAVSKIIGVMKTLIDKENKEQ